MHNLPELKRFKFRKINIGYGKGNLMAYIKVPLKTTININRIVTVFYNDFSPVYRTKGESHDFWEIVYVDRGELDLRGGDVVRHMKEGEIIFHQPGEFHSVRCDGSHTSAVFIITFDCRSPAMRYFSGRAMPVPKELRTVIKKLIDECSRNFYVSKYPLVRLPDAPIGGQQLIRIYLEEFLIRMMRSEEKKQEKITIFTSRTALENSLAEELCQYLQEHIYEKITLEELCHQFHFGKSHLSRVFHDSTGQSIMHYFLELKITEAKKLLREENNTITEISEKLGFENPQYFSRIFRRYTGASPRSFRNALVNSGAVYVRKI